MSYIVSHGVTGFVEHDVCRPGHFQHCREPKALIFYLLGELGPSGLELGHGGFDVVAHERHLVMFRGSPSRLPPSPSPPLRWDGRRARTGPCPENQPAAVDIDIRPFEDVPKEGAGGIGVVGIYESVNASDHALKVARVSCLLPRPKLKGRPAAPPRRASSSWAATRNNCASPHGPATSCTPTGRPLGAI